jgi:hypothetical protein
MKYIPILLLMFLINSDKAISLGSYVFDGENSQTVFTFKENNQFNKTSYLNYCGMGDSSNGTYTVSNDTLNLDFSEEVNKAKKELESQYFKVLKRTETDLDSISLKLNIVPLHAEIEEVSDRYITIDGIEHFQYSFYNESFELKLPKKDTSEITFGHFSGNNQYQFSINTTEDVELEVGVSFVIEELLTEKEQFLIKKIKDDKLILKHIKDGESSKRLNFFKNT